MGSIRHLPPRKTPARRWPRATHSSPDRGTGTPRLTATVTGTLSLSKPAPYAAKLKRETRATRSMMWLWTGEVASDGQGYRVVGTGPKGTMSIPADIARRFPAVLQLRLAGMNANGKVYTA